MPSCNTYPGDRGDFVGKVQRPLKMLTCLWQREEIAVKRSERAVSGGHPLAMIDLLGDAQALPGTF